MGLFDAFSGFGDFLQGSFDPNYTGTEEGSDLMASGTQDMLGSITEPIEQSTGFDVTGAVEGLTGWNLSEDSQVIDPGIQQTQTQEPGNNVGLWIMGGVGLLIAILLFK